MTRPRFPLRSHQSGIALVISMLMLLGLTLVALSGLDSSILDERMAGNYKHSLQAFNAAESGMVAALEKLQQPCGLENGLSDELQLGGPLLAANLSYSVGSGTMVGGHFRVSVRDNEEPDGDPTRDHDGIVILRSQGGDESALATVEQTVQHPGTRADIALLTQETLTFRGNPTVSGCLVNVHSNADIVIEDGGVLDGIVSASGVVSNPGNATIGGGIENHVQAVVMPEINPADLAARASFTLAASGKVLDSDGAPLLDLNGDALSPTAGDDWNGWIFEGSRWKLTGSSPPLNGIYYAESDVLLDPVPAGPASPPWLTTIVAEGNLEVSSDLKAAAYPSPLQLGETHNLLFVAGGDLSISGTASMHLTGTLAAREQIQLSGTTTVDGTVLARGADDAYSLVEENLIDGDITLSNAGQGHSDSGSLTIRNWRGDRG